MPQPEDAVGRRFPESQNGFSSHASLASGNSRSRISCYGLHNFLGGLAVAAVFIAGVRLGLAPGSPPPPTTCRRSWATCCASPTEEGAIIQEVLRMRAPARERAIDRYRRCGRDSASRPAAERFFSRVKVSPRTRRVKQPREISLRLRDFSSTWAPRQCSRGIECTARPPTRACAARFAVPVRAAAGSHRSLPVDGGTP